MLDCLPGLRARIEDNPVSRLVDSGRHGDLVRLGCDLFQQASACPGQLGKIGVVIFRYDKHMGRRLRAVIAERYRARTLQHPHRRGLARRDAAEETVAHTTILTCDASARLPTYMVALLRILGCSRASKGTGRLTPVPQGVRPAAIRGRHAAAHVTRDDAGPARDGRWGRRIVEASRQARFRRENQT